MVVLNLGSFLMKVDHSWLLSETEIEKKAFVRHIPEYTSLSLSLQYFPHD